MDQAVMLPNSKQRLYHSLNGRTYRIMIHKPAGPAPAAGYPVLYLLDANALFFTTVEAVRAQSVRSEKTGVVPAVVVGIGYDREEAFPPERHYDFTLPGSPSLLPKRPDGKPWPKQGGAESFLTFIEDELKPMIEGEIPINRSCQSILGHSLGGFFVLHTLFTKPHAFQTYIASSPSIHWNEPLLKQEEQEFTVWLQDHPEADISVLLATGELEQHHHIPMCANARSMSERLSTLAGLGVHAEYKEFEDENHASVLPGLISRGLRFALRKVKP
ncbi:enterobactin esterase [Paenibacillus sp. CAA11]|uniref:alpha/beta hydrolase n=1 Tax=Paenibacillus sp. CAA11 TaxID=1532905 RepID=UPI000D367155|nr:alpha/beta hydrolase-fold protein [Paenibacillus sp. CAA11]AWB43785.1 enterobactin esterase [Paenibacillus sp. CAA11]